MSKGLEALDRMSFHRFDEQYKEWDKDYEIVEQCLKTIDNSKPSEALKDLKELHELAYGSEGWKIEQIVQSSHIKQALLKLQEQEKIFDKIKQHTAYNKEQMKFTIEIEVDDFNSSKEWDEFKEVMTK